MSTTTGNIKISQLSQLSAIDNGDKLRIPVSRDKSATSTPDWESYSVSASVLSSFVEDSLGLGTAAYEDKSAFDAAGAATIAADYVVAKFPVVTNGSGITVTPTIDGNGKTTYKVSTSAEVFHYKGNKTALSELPSTGNTTGDVWSVGPANAVGSTLYAWDGDEWINIGGANGITGVDTTSSKGVALAKNTNGTVKVNVTPGSVANGNDSVVTGGAVYSAIEEAEGRCDANGTAQGLINALGGSATSSNGSYVNVTVNTSKGQASGVTVSETDALTTAVSNANSALQSVSVLGKTLNKTTNSITVEEAKTALGLDDLNNQGSKELEKELGKYDLVSEITFNTSDRYYYISTSGTKKGSGDNYNCFISNEIPLKQGNLYLIQADCLDYNNDHDPLPADMALMSKVDKKEYQKTDGTIATDIVYEPLPNHYITLNNGGYDVPASHYFVFFATENMNVVICGYNNPYGNTNNVLYEVKYGAFVEAASKLLTINGDLMKVIVEAIVKNKKDIDSINENMKSLGDIHANSIDLDDFPSVQGKPMVVVANRRPSAADTNHGDDVPNRIGQIWVDTTNKKAYIAVALGSTGDDSWKQITI